MYIIPFIFSRLRQEEELKQKVSASEKRQRQGFAELARGNFVVVFGHVEHGCIIAVQMPLSSERGKINGN